MKHCMILMKSRPIFKLYTSLFSRTVLGVALVVWVEAFLVLLGLDHREVDLLTMAKSAELDLVEEIAKIASKIWRNFVVVTCAQMMDLAHEKGLV